MVARARPVEACDYVEFRREVLQRRLDGDVGHELCGQLPIPVCRNPSLDDDVGLVYIVGGLG